MSERKTYRLTQEQYDKLLEASKAQPVMFLSGGIPMFESPQERANRAWEKLGEELGFNPYTVKAGKDEFEFSAQETRP